MIIHNICITRSDQSLDLHDTSEFEMDWITRCHKLSQVSELFGSVNPDIDTYRIAYAESIREVYLRELLRNLSCCIIYFI